MRDFNIGIKLIFIVLLTLALDSMSPAVSSKITRHNSSSEMLKGEIENVVIGSRGTIQLGRAAKSLIEEFDDFSDVWSINSIIVSGGTVYFGTSPNGGIYKYSLNKITKIYPQETEQEKSQDNSSNEETPKEASSDKPNEIIEKEELLSNEHIFAIATDIAGRLLAGISGDKCRLCRFEKNKMETVFEPNDAKYIFAITIDEAGNIYLGTGPEGKIYKLDSLGKKTQLIYDSRDKNILSLAVGPDGFIYAGSDSRGLIYKIDPQSKDATVLYDSEQPEIAALLFPPESYNNDHSSNSAPDLAGCLYAAATTAKIVRTQTQFAASMPSGPPEGRPEIDEDREEPEPDGKDEVEDKEEEESNSENNGDERKLEIANTKESTPDKPAKPTPPVRRSTRTTSASYIYKITPDGFVTDVFNETAVFFCLAQQDNKLMVGTGNKAQLYSIDPASEQQAVIYEDEQAVQITAIALAGDDVYLGTANPAKLLKLETDFAPEGTYISDLIDADQPANWGKLQLEADIPAGCKVLAASRSGNVKDVNDPTFSEWTDLVEVTEPVQLQCPLGRFCQYKLVLQSENGDKSPLIREIAVASTVPNLAPKVESVTINRIQAPNKEGTFKISYRTTDENEDKLIYKIDFRKVGRTNWIELEDELEAAVFEWDGKTVEDSRYEIRVTASDERSNTTSTKLTGSRISEPIVVDNTGPVATEMKITTTEQNDRKFMVFETEIMDQLSAIGQLEYTIDSNADWIGTVPDDLVYDTTKEHFTIKINAEKDLPKGDHILTIKVSDAVGNTTYKTYEVNAD